MSVSLDEQLLHTCFRSLPIPTAFGKIWQQVLHAKKPFHCRLVCFFTAPWQSMQRMPAAGIVIIDGVNLAGVLVIRHFRHCNPSALFTCKHFRQCFIMSASGCANCARGKASAIFIVLQPQHLCFFRFSASNRLRWDGGFPCQQVMHEARLLARTRSHCLCSKASKGRSCRHF